MRAATALVIVAATVAVAAGSQYLIRAYGSTYTVLVVYAWLGIAAVTLVGLLWLYYQIGLGPRATVSERTAFRIERDLARALASKSKANQTKASKLKERASSLSKLIEPATEARNVFQRRVRLTNSVMALIFVLSSSFWIFASMAPLAWPTMSWFATERTPDAYHAALFSMDQVTRGTLFDLFDVFDWNMSGFHANPDNEWFSAFIVIYRCLIGGALVAAVVVRLGMHEDWREKAAHEAAETMKVRLTKLARLSSASPSPA